MNGEEKKPWEEGYVFGDDPINEEPEAGPWTMNFNADPSTLKKKEPSPSPLVGENGTSKSTVGGSGQPRPKKVEPLSKIQSEDIPPDNDWVNTFSGTISAPKKTGKSFNELSIKEKEAYVSEFKDLDQKISEYEEYADKQRAINNYSSSSGVNYYKNKIEEFEERKAQIEYVAGEYIRKKNEVDVRDLAIQKAEQKAREGVQTIDGAMVPGTEGMSISPDPVDVALNYLDEAEPGRAVVMRDKMRQGKFTELDRQSLTAQGFTIQAESLNNKMQLKSESMGAEFWDELGSEMQRYQELKPNVSDSGWTGTQLELTEYNELTQSLQDKMTNPDMVTLQNMRQQAEEVRDKYKTSDSTFLPRYLKDVKERRQKETDRAYKSRSISPLLNTAYDVGRIVGHTGAKIWTDLATIPRNLAGDPVRYDFTDKWAESAEDWSEAINRTYPAPSHLGRNFVEDVAVVDGHQLVLDDKRNVVSVRDSEGYLLHDKEKAVRLVEEYNKEKERYPVSKEFNFGAGAYQTAQTITEMGLELLPITGFVGKGARLLNMGNKSADIIGLFTGITVQTHNDAYNAGLDNGLSGRAATLYALGISAGITGIAMINPLEARLASKMVGNKKAASSGAKRFVDALSKSGKSKSEYLATRKDAFLSSQSAWLKNTVGETGEELLEMPAEDATQYIFNQVASGDFSIDRSVNEYLNTMAIAAAAGGVFSLIDVKSRSQLSQEMLRSAIDNIPEVEKILNDYVGKGFLRPNGTVTPLTEAEAQSLILDMKSIKSKTDIIERGSDLNEHQQVKLTELLRMKHSMEDMLQDSDVDSNMKNSVKEILKDVDSQISHFIERKSEDPYYEVNGKVVDRDEFYESMTPAVAEDIVRGKSDVHIRNDPTAITDLENLITKSQIPKDKGSGFAQSFERVDDLGAVLEGGKGVRIGDTDLIFTEEEDGGITLESIKTDPDKRGKGSAKKALESFVKTADDQGRAIELKVAPEEGSDMSKEDLAKFYEKLGFKPQEGDPDVMVRMPSLVNSTGPGNPKPPTRSSKLFTEKGERKHKKRQSDNLDAVVSTVDHPKYGSLYRWAKRNGYDKIRFFGGRGDDVGIAFHNTNRKDISFNVNHSQYDSYLKDQEAVDRAVAHEIVHAVVNQSMERTPGLSDEFNAELSNLRDHLNKQDHSAAPAHVKRMIGHINSGNPEEMVTYALTDSQVAEYFDSIVTGNAVSRSQTIWGKIKELILGMVRKSDRSMLDEVNRIMDDYVGDFRGNSAFYKPSRDVRKVSSKYIEQKFGDSNSKPVKVKSLNYEFARKVAEAFEDMEHNPSDPEVREAYMQLVKESMQQYQSLLDAGYEFELVSEEPYSNSKEMIDDLINNKRIKVLSTKSAFGEIGPEQVKDNLLLGKTLFKDVNGATMLANDIFRSVHDVFGHGELGNGFGAVGEENAWMNHARMFSPKARRAMTTETRGQNSWVNFSGINDQAKKEMREANQQIRDGNEDLGRKMLKAAQEKFRFSEQKIGLLPDEFMEPMVDRKAQPDLISTHGQTSNVNMAAHMTKDTEGNYLFYHRTDKNFVGENVEPRFHGTNRHTGSDRLGAVSYYYTKPGDTERALRGAHGTKVVKVAPDKVYPYNSDPYNFKDIAKARFLRDFPETMWNVSEERRLDYTGKVASEHGFDMVVADWGGRVALRAESHKPLPIEKNPPAVASEGVTLTPEEKLQELSEEIKAQMKGRSANNPINPETDPELMDLIVYVANNLVEQGHTDPDGLIDELKESAVEGEDGYYSVEDIDNNRDFILEEAGLSTEPPEASPPGKDNGGGAKPSREGPLEVPEETWMDQVRTALQNRFRRLDVFQKAAVEGGIEISEYLDVSTNRELLTGRAKAKLDDLWHEVVRSKKNQPPALFERMKEAGVNLDKFGIYMYAKHAPERNAKIRAETAEEEGGPMEAGSGMTDEQAADILAEVEASGDLEIYQEFEEEFRNKVIKPNQQTLVESGLHSQEDIDNMNTSFKNYVPLMVSEKRKGKKSASTKGSMDVRGRDIYRAKGAEHFTHVDRENPVTAMLLNYQMSIIRAETNKVNQKLLAFAEEVGPPHFKVSRPQYSPVRDRLGETQKLIPIVDKEQQNRSVMLKVDGKPVMIEVLDEPLRKSLKGTGVLRGIKYLHKFNSFLRAVNTLYNPEFVLGNFTKDIQTSAINISAEEEKGMKRDLLKNVHKAMKGVWDNEAGNKSEWASIAKEMQDAGGDISWLVVDDVDRASEKMKQAFEDYKSTRTDRKLRMAFRDTLGFIERVNKSVEMSVRLSAYKAARDREWSPQRAAKLAKNLTVNFEKKGNWGVLMDSMYLFANAGVQGSAVILTAMGKSRKVRAITVGITAGSFLLRMYNDWTDGDDEEYSKLEDGIKERNWVFMTPEGNRFMIPLPWGYNVFKYAGDLMYEVATNKTKPGEAAVKGLISVSNAFNPVSSATLLQTISPTVLDPTVQWAENKNWFAGPLYKENSPFTPKEKESSRHFSSVRPTSKAVTDWLNEVSGGTKIERGYIDRNPELLDHVVDSYSGGLGRFTMNVVNGGLELAKGDIPEPNNIPFARRFYGKPSEYRNIKQVYEFRDRFRVDMFSERETRELQKAVEASVEDGSLEFDQASRIMKEFDRGQERIRLSRSHPNLEPKQIDMFLKD